MSHAHWVRLNEETPIAFREALAQHHVNLVTFDRSSDALIDLLHKHADLIPDGHQFWSVGKSIKELEISLAHDLTRIRSLPESVVADLFRDIMNLVNLFFKVTGEESPFLSLRTITTQYFEGNPNSVSSCFHRDSATVSLFRTYLGAGTQWVDNENVIRSAWVNTSIQNADEPANRYILNPDKLLESGCSTIAMLKGELRAKGMDERSKDFVKNFIALDKVEDYNIGNALIHRGPPTSVGDKRLLLTVSTFKPPLA